MIPSAKVSDFVDCSDWRSKLMISSMSHIAGNSNRPRSQVDRHVCPNLRFYSSVAANPCLPPHFSIFPPSVTPSFPSQNYHCSHQELVLAFIWPNFFSTRDFPAIARKPDSGTKCITQSSNQEKNRQCRIIAELKKFACDFRWRLDSPRSAFKIA